MEFHMPYSTYTERYSTKYLALYHALRDEITSGRLPFAAKLPSSRELAARTYAAYAAACLAAGVSWADAGSYVLPRGRCGACFGFSHLSEQEMREGAARLQQASRGFIGEADGIS